MILILSLLVGFVVAGAVYLLWSVFENLAAEDQAAAKAPPSPPEDEPE